MNLFKIKKSIIFRSDTGNDLLAFLIEEIDNILKLNFGNKINIVENKIFFTQSWFAIASVEMLRFVNGGEINIEKTIKTYRLNYAIHFHFNYLLCLFILMISFIAVHINNYEPIFYLYAFLGIIFLSIWVTVLNSVSETFFYNLMLKAIKKADGIKV